MDEKLDDELIVQSILLAAAHHNVPELTNLLRDGSANVQDPETGYTPLHSAISALTPDDQDTNGERSLTAPDDQKNKPADDSSKELEKATATVQLLLQHGAIWNELDANNETPGCLALRLGLSDLYDIIVSAGVRAEILFSRLKEYEMITDADEDEDINDRPTDREESLESAAVDDKSSGVDTAQPEADHPSESTDVNSQDYLQSILRFQGDRLLDDADNGVMMAWEAGIMRRTVDALVHKEGLRILNVGFGMGIIDSIFQSRLPAAHHIIEAHPMVLQKMQDDGWEDKPGVHVHKGTWQDVLPKLVEENEMFDAIYFDTFAEDYSALREFFTDYVIALLSPEGGKDGKGGSWSFFHGLGADRQVCYDVYTKVVEIDLFEAGFDVDWEVVPVPDLDGQESWKGVRRKYWALDEYRLPICRFMG
ncbi:MAG: hypothetical protein M1825_001651 [Sarcosagium campestre]|nr:MAG: hypothetical protein M1825_001651 [Sarcosagium campestre]